MQGVRLLIPALRGILCAWVLQFQSPDVQSYLPPDQAAQGFIQPDFG